MDSDSDDDEPPLPVTTKQIRPKYIRASDTEENDDEADAAQDDEDAAEDEDDAGEDLQDLPASQLEATLQQEVKVH